MNDLVSIIDCKLIMNKILYIFLIFIVGACSNSEPQEPDEGIIVYKISLSDRKSNNIAYYIPKQTVLQFRNNNTALSLGVKSFFSFKQITLPVENKNYSALMIMGKTYLYETTCGNLAYGYGNDEVIDIKKTRDKKVICGYECRKAIITWKDNPLQTVVYYTDNIKIENPNINTPFSEIDGVMLEFSANVIGLDMKFEAEKVIISKIDTSCFVIPNYCEKVSYDKLDNIVEDFK